MPVSQKSYATARKARAGGRLDRDDLIVRLAAQLFTHKGRDQTAEVAPAAGTADDHVGLDAVFVQRGLGLQTDDRLVQQHLVQHAAEHIAVSGVADGDFNRLRNRAAERAGGAGMLRKNFPADLGRVGRGGGDLRAVGAHDLAAEGLLLVAAFDHIHPAVKPEVAAGHGQGRAPLAGAGLGGDALQALFLGIIGLRHGGVELVAAAGVVAFEFVVDLRGRAQLLFQTVGAHQRGRTVHLVETADVFGNFDEGGVVVQLLRDQLLTEDAAHLFRGQGLTGPRVQQRCRLVLHVGTEVVPCFRDLVFAEIDFVGDVGCAHGFGSFLSRDKRKLLSLLHAGTGV